MKKCTYCGKEYGDEATTCPVDGAQLQLQGAAPTAQTAAYAGRTSNGVAIASMILGIVSIVLCGGPLCGIPAVICGHIALSRAKSEPMVYGGRGMAITGLVTGYIGIVLIFFAAIFAGMLLPALAKAKQKAEEINCSGNLKQVGLAARIWSGEHNGTLPNSFMDMTNELGNPNVLICPGDPHHHRSASTAIQVWDPANVSYEFLTPGVPAGPVQRQVIIRCPIHGLELLGDGTVNRKKPKQ